MRPQRSVGRGTGGATGNSFKLVMKSSSPLGWKEQRALPTPSSCILPGSVQREEARRFLPPPLVLESTCEPSLFIHSAHFRDQVFCLMGD